MISPSPQCVGQEFVRQYYTMLHEAPDFMHRFYSHDSSFIHGGHVNGSVHGQINIHKKILSLNFRDCHARIRQVDSLGTIDDAVVVQVSGELSNDGQPMRRFVQTFVLAPQSPKKYYVHNDIFRYQDEVFVDKCDFTGTALCTPTADSLESYYSSNISKSQEHQCSSNQNVFDAPPNSPSMGNMIDSQVTLPIQSSSPSECKEGIRAEDQSDGRTRMDAGDRNEFSMGHRRDSVNVVHYLVANDQSEDSKDDESCCIDSKRCKNGPGPETPPAFSRVETLSSWASVTSSEKSRSAIFCGRSDDGRSSKRDESGDGGPRLPSEFRRESSTKKSDDCRNSEVRRESIREERIDARNSWNAEASRRRDSVQLFVGNLPNDVSVPTLKKIFGRFGEVLEVRIVRKVSSNRDVPNFGFLSLDNAETARKILEARPYHLDNGHRLNVEERKSDQLRYPGSSFILQHRNRPATQLSSSGRGWWGGYKGGDGRSGSSKSFDGFGSSGRSKGGVGRE